MDSEKTLLQYKIKWKYKKFWWITSLD
jgi:hypothetical protein